MKKICLSLLTCILLASCTKYSDQELIDSVNITVNDLSIYDFESFSDSGDRYVFGYQWPNSISVDVTDIININIETTELVKEISSLSCYYYNTSDEESLPHGEKLFTYTDIGNNITIDLNDFSSFFNQTKEVGTTTVEGIEIEYTFYKELLFFVNVKYINRRVGTYRFAIAPKNEWHYIDY